MGCYAFKQPGNNGYLRSNNDKTIPPNKPGMPDL